MFVPANNKEWYLMQWNDDSFKEYNMFFPERYSETRNNTKIKLFKTLLKYLAIQLIH
jgi:hypothetical protein